MSKTLRDLLALVIALVAPLAVGGLSSIATVSSIPTWYRGLNRPSWSPPDWAFAPAWTVLYILMGMAAWLVWRTGWEKGAVRAALAVFAGQLALNGLWSILFFGLQSPGAGLIEIIILWCAILLTTVLFFGLDRLAGLLFVPYVLWVTFASGLNFAIWSLNR